MTKKEFINLLNAGGNDFVTLPDNLIVFDGDLDLRNSQITSLGNLEVVLGDLYLQNTPITSLGNLKEVGGVLDLRNTQIQSLGNLEKVGWNLYLGNTPLAEKYSIKELEKMYPQFKGKFIFHQLNAEKSSNKFIEFGIWLQNKALATYQVGGSYEGMWHVHYPEFGYITSEELIQYWNAENNNHI